MKRFRPGMIHRTERVVREHKSGSALLLGRGGGRRRAPVSTPARLVVRRNAQASAGGAGGGAAVVERTRLAGCGLDEGETDGGESRMRLVMMTAAAAAAVAGRSGRAREGRSKVSCVVVVVVDSGRQQQHGVVQPQCSRSTGTCPCLVSTRMTVRRSSRRRRRRQPAPSSAWPSAAARRRSLIGRSWGRRRRAQRPHLASSHLAQRPSVPALPPPSRPLARSSASSRYVCPASPLLLCFESVGFGGVC